MYFKVLEPKVGKGSGLFLNDVLINQMPYLVYLIKIGHFVLLFERI